MSWVAGIDYSTHAIDIVYVDEDGKQPPMWRHFPMRGADAFERTRDIHVGVPIEIDQDEVLAIGIEEPRGHQTGPLFRVQGSILARIPKRVLVQPWIPSQWRLAVGLKGNASKDEIRLHVARTIVVNRDEMPNNQPILNGTWTQDACDAYCIAMATLGALAPFPTAAENA